MKRLLAFLFLPSLVLAQLTPVLPTAATQAQVNAGTSATTFVSPATLAGATGGTGGSGVSLSRTVTQANSFAIGNVVFNNGSGGVDNYILSDNSNVTTSHVDGVVTAASGTAFTICLAGEETVLTGLAANTTYYLGTSGTLVTPSPTATGSTIVAVLRTGLASNGVVSPPNEFLVGPLNLAGGASIVTGQLPIANLALRTGISSACVGGAVTIADTGATASSSYWFTTWAKGTVTTPQSYMVTATSVGTSITIQSSSASDTSTVRWFGIN